eukprot:SAG31_NODE_498_length_14861_cov_3.405026_10_plen_75_part_00
MRQRCGAEADFRIMRIRTPNAAADRRCDIDAMRDVRTAGAARRGGHRHAINMTAARRLLGSYGNKLDLHVGPNM